MAGLLPHKGLTTPSTRKGLRAYWRVAAATGLAFCRLHYQTNDSIHQLLLRGPVRRAVAELGPRKRRQESHMGTKTTVDADNKKLHLTTVMAKVKDKDLEEPKKSVCKTLLLQRTTTTTIGRMAWQKQVVPVITKHFKYKGHGAM